MWTATIRISPAAHTSKNSLNRAMFLWCSFEWIWISANSKKYASECRAAFRCTLKGYWAVSLLGLIDILSLLFHTHTSIYIHTRIHTRTHARTHTPTHPPIHPPTTHPRYTHTHAHTHTHSHTHTALQTPYFVDFPAPAGSLLQIW